mgnify:CR=1 FL=1
MSIVAVEAPERPSTEAKRALLARLPARFGNRFSAGTALREQHANTLTWIVCQPPDAVVFAMCIGPAVAGGRVSHRGSVGRLLLIVRFGHSIL